MYKDYHTNNLRKCDLVRKYRVSRPTINKTLYRGRHNDFTIHNSTNAKFRCAKYGFKRLAKIETKIQERLKKQARRYNKGYTGEMMHFDTKRLPLLKGEFPKNRYEYLFISIDDFSRELYMSIQPDKTQHSSKRFLDQVLDECPYLIEQVYSDNGLEHKGNERHAFVKLCRESNIEQRFTKVKHPWTNGKAERVIGTLMEM